MSLLQSLSENDEGIPPAAPFVASTGSNANDTIAPQQGVAHRNTQDIFVDAFVSDDNSLDTATYEETLYELFGKRRTSIAQPRPEILVYPGDSGPVLTYNENDV